MWLPLTSPTKQRRALVGLTWCLIPNTVFQLGLCAQRMSHKEFQGVMQSNWFDISLVDIRVLTVWFM